MNHILIPASFLAVAMPAVHSILITDSGIRSWKQEQPQAVFYGATDNTGITEPAASDDPAWYNNYE